MAEDCLNGLKGWMIDGRGNPTSVLVVGMEAALTMAARSRARQTMSVADSMNVLANVIATSPCDLQLMISCVVPLVMLAEAERMAGLWIARGACVDLVPDLALGPMTPSRDVMVPHEGS